MTQVTPYKIQIMKYSPTAAIFLLIFCPSRFIKMAVLYSIDRELKTNKDLLKQLPADRIKHIENTETGRTKKLRESILQSLLYVCQALMLGLALGVYFKWFFGPISPKVSSIFQISGAILILWATLSEIGWKISSWDHESFTEIINRFIFRFSYFFGTWFFILPIGWTLF